MKVAVLFLFLIQILCPLSRADDPRSEAAWMKTGVGGMFPNFQRVTFSTFPDDKDIVAVNCQVSEDWTGGLLVFHHTGDRIDWFAKLPDAYLKGAGDYVMSCEWRHLDALNLTLLEVFDSSHTGNGSLWLFALEGHELRLVLDASRAVDRHHEHSSGGIPSVVSSRVFEGGQLNVEYPVPKGSKYEIVRLAGTEIALDDDDKVLSKKPILATWTWDLGKRVFVQTKSGD